MTQRSRSFPYECLYRPCTGRLDGWSCSWTRSPSQGLVAKGPSHGMGVAEPLCSDGPCALWPAQMLSRWLSPVGLGLHLRCIREERGRPALPMARQRHLSHGRAATAAGRALGHRQGGGSTLPSPCQGCALIQPDVSASRGIPEPAQTW